jgi:hypothetical protein
MKSVLLFSLILLFGCAIESSSNIANIGISFEQGSLSIPYASGCHTSGHVVQKNECVSASCPKYSCSYMYPVEIIKGNTIDINRPLFFKNARFSFEIAKQIDAINYGQIVNGTDDDSFKKAVSALGAGSYGVTVTLVSGSENLSYEFQLSVKP